VAALLVRDHGCKICMNLSPIFLEGSRACIENTMRLQSTVVMEAVGAMRPVDGSRCKEQWIFDQQQITAVMIARSRKRPAACVAAGRDSPVSISPMPGFERFVNRSAMEI
jgi:hypothetical protein